MVKHISATQAVREFSELLNRIKFNGEQYVIERSGKPVALMEPVKANERSNKLTELESLLNGLPHLKEELEAFAADIEDLWTDQPKMPEEISWA